MYRNRNENYNENWKVNLYGKCIFFEGVLCK